MNLVRITTSVFKLINNIKAMGNIYFTQDKTPAYKYATVNTAGTTAIWTPTTGNKLVITGINAYNDAAAQVFTFYFGTTVAGPSAFIKFAVGASASVYFDLDPIDAQIEDYVVYVKGSGTGATAGQEITITGFEEPI